MFFSTVIQGNSAYSWNTMPRSGPGAPTSRPSTRILPELGSEKPATALSRVDLPQPEGPSRQTNWPCGISSWMSCRATTWRPSPANTLPTRLMRICAAWAAVEAIISVLQAAVPAQQVVVQAVHGDVDRQPQQADGDHAGDDLVGPEVLARLKNAETQAIVHRDHLGHDDDDEGGADADPHARQD